MNGDLKTSAITLTVCQQQTVVETNADGKNWLLKT